MLAAVLQRAIPLFRNIQNMLSQSGLSEEYLHIIFKALGVCLLTQLAADVCRDVGEQALANKAEFAGKYRCCYWHCRCSKKSEVLRCL